MNLPTKNTIGLIIRSSVGRFKHAPTSKSCLKGINDVRACAYLYFDTGLSKALGTLLTIT